MFSTLVFLFNTYYVLFSYLSPYNTINLNKVPVIEKDMSMEIFLSTTNQQSFLFFTRKKQLFLQMRLGTVWKRPQLLHSDFQRDLHCIFFHNVIFYCYINTLQQLVVKRYPAVAMVFYLPENTDFLYSNPQLYIFQNELLLFYLSKNKETQLTQIRAINPLTRYTPFSFEHTFQQLSSFMIFPQGDDLILQVLTKEENQLFILKKDCAIAPMQKLSSPSSLADSKQEELELLRTELEEKEKQLHHLNEMLQSATKQYNELMDVAYCYREEAKKWRNKITTIHR